MSKKKLSKLLALYLPYVVIGLVATNLGEAWRLAVGKELGDKIVSLMDTLPAAFSNPLPSLHPLDLLVGLCCGAAMRLAVYLKGKNAKKYRHGLEYGSARWGTPKDIEPFMAPKFEDNIILTKTERLMMSNRPPDPKNARNKNVLVVGGSGSGKTRFWLKPNLLQCHSSYVVTDPKGTIVLECGNAMLKNGYKVKILNTINFKKSMHYNPFAYVHSEKDILKLVTTLMTNTKGEGSGGDPFWEKSERLLLTALIAYLHYEAPTEEQNFATLLEMLNNTDEWHRENNIQNYRRRRDIAEEIMKVLDCQFDPNQVGMFLWGKIPEKYADVEDLTEKILHEARVFITPGFIFGTNGKRYIRISLCAKDEKMKEALERIKKVFEK